MNARNAMRRVIICVMAFVFAGVLAGVAAGSAKAITWNSPICTGFASCDAAGHGNAGYENVYTQSFWGMTAGHNCTNYAAYRLIHNGIDASYLRGQGMAYQWGPVAASHGVAEDKSPRVGDIAWFTVAAVGGVGHVAYVESVNAAAGTVLVSEDNYGGNFDYRVYNIGDVSAFIHFGGGSAAVSDGSFVQVAGSSAIYRIAGGAPLYVSNWAAVGGSQPYTVISQAQFNALNAVPSDGTFIADTSDGRVYEVVGGAPLYVSAADAAKVPGWGSRPIVGVDHYDLANLDHLRRYPADGTLISNVDDGRAYVVAGGAPLYISAADAGKVPGWGTKPVTGVSGYEFGAYQHLRQYPADGTFIANVDNGRAYEVAGGAPLYISAADAAKVPGWGSRTVTGVSGYEFGAYQHLRQYPVNGTLIGNVGDGTAYVVAGGAPIPNTGANASSIPGWGTQPVTVTSSYEFTAHEHLLARPATGTVLIAAGKHYRVWSGAAYRTTSGTGTVVDPVAVAHAGGSGVWSHLAAIPAIGLTVPASSVPSSTKPAIRVVWSIGSAPLKATVKYTVQRRTVTVSSNGTRRHSTPVTWLKATTVTSAAFSAANGTQTQFRVQAVDALGNRSSWSSWRTSTMPTDDRSAVLRYSKGWTRPSSTSYFDGTYTTTIKQGASATATVWASSVSIVGAKARTAGSFAVYVDGVKKMTVSSHAPKNAFRQTLARVSLSYGHHTVRVVNLATTGHPRLYLDALVVTS